MSADNTVSVFLDVRIVGSRSGGPSRYKAEWVARGTGTVMYSSKVCDQKHQAVTLARRYLASVAHLKDTTGNNCVGHVSVTTPDGHGAFCKWCGETLA